MEDTTWFEEGSVEDQLTHLSQLIYCGEENAKTNFKTLLNLVPVDLVTTENARDYRTLLQDAVFQGKQDFVRMLLESGVDPSARLAPQTYCGTPYHTVVDEAVILKEGWHGGSSEMLDILSEYTDVSVAVNLDKLAKWLNDNNGEEFKKILPLLPVDMVTTSNVGRDGTFLQEAVKQDKQDFVRILLDFGVDPTAPLQNGMSSPLEMAVSRDQKEMLKILTEYREIPDKVKLLQLSKLMGSSDDVKKSKDEFQSILCSLPTNLVSTTNVRYGTLMLEATIDNKQDFLRLLLEKGVDPSIKASDDESNPTAVEYAVLNECNEALVIMQEFVEIPNDVKFKRLARLTDHSNGFGEKAKKEFAEMLRTMPVDLVSTNSVPGKGTLLQDAIQRNKKDFVRILLENGVDPTATSDDKKDTPLEIAMACHQHLEVLLILAKFMEVPDNVKHIQLALLANSDETGEGTNEEFHKILHSMPVDLVSTKKPEQGGCGTILQDAVQMGKANFVRSLLEFGVDPTAVCEEKSDTPMDISVSSESSHCPDIRRLLGKFTEMPVNVKLFHLSTLMFRDEAKDEEEFRKMLGSLPVELVSSRNVRGQGSLMQCAVKKHKKDFVRILLEFGADPNRATEGFEKTPMEIALGRVYSYTFEVLMLLAGSVNDETPTSTKLKILSEMMEWYFLDGNYAEEFKKNLDGLSVAEVTKKQQEISWYFSNPMETNRINVTWVQFSAAEGKTEYLQLLFDHGLDPACQVEGTPRAIELAAVNGQVDAFSLLAARLHMDSHNSEWFQLGQLLVFGMAGKVDQFKELLTRVPLDKVSSQPVYRSTLLQELARSGKVSAVAALLQYGVDPELTLENALNGWTPEMLAFKRNHLEVLVELNKVKELQPCIMESSMGMQILRREERAWRKKIEEKQEFCQEEEMAWRKKMEEKQEKLVLKEELREELLALLNIRGSTSKAEQGVDNKANLFNLHVLVSAAYFVSGFFACYLFGSNFH